MKSFVPKVSVGVPVYNGERYIRLAVDSLLKQDFEDFEVIISDNASTDETAEICKAYAARDSRVRYYRNEANIGSARNYNRVLELARGEFFKWCAHDDICHPRFLSRCMEVMETAPRAVVLVYPQCDLIGEFGESLGRAPDRMETKAQHPHRRLAHALRNIGYAYALWGVLRTDYLRRTAMAGGIHCWDDVLLVELSLLGEIWEIPEVLFQLRYHLGNALGVCSTEQGREVWQDPNKADRKTRKALLAWSDPSHANKKIWLPVREERYCEYVKRIHHTPLPPIEKLLCYLTVPTVCYWRRLRNFAATWKRRMVKALSKAALSGLETGSRSKENKIS